jgi:integrase
MCKQRLADGRLFGELRPAKLSWEDVEDLYAAMKRSGLGPDWIRRCATVLNRTLDYAKKRKLIDSNPCQDATRPRVVRTKPYSPTREDVELLMANVRAFERDGVGDEELVDVLEIIKGTGMRKGELLALWIENLDMKNAEVHIAWAIEDGGPGVGTVRTPTKKADWRDVPMTKAVFAAFERQLERRRRVRGEAPAATDYVFPRNLEGTEPIRPDTLSDQLSEARGSSNVTFLDLRHYAATTMLDADVPYRTVADILGNSEATLRLHYDGRTDTGKRAAIDALD